MAATSCYKHAVRVFKHNLCYRSGSRHFSTTRQGAINSQPVSGIINNKRMYFVDEESTIYSQHKALFDQKSSTFIPDLSRFVHELESSETLYKQVKCLSMQWGKANDAKVRPALERIMNRLGSAIHKFHYGPPSWDAAFAITYNATSISMPYPVLSYSTIKSRDDSMFHDLLAIPSIRHVTLYQCTNLLRELHKPRWTSYQDSVDNPEPPYPDLSKARTSPLEYLALRDNPRDNIEDLCQLMIWPKALRVLDCEFGQAQEYVDEEWPWDPSQLIAAMAPQRASLEQISLDCTGRTSTLGTLGTSLRGYPCLKRLSIPRNFLASLHSDEAVAYVSDPDEEAHLYYRHAHVYTALPPALEELILNVDQDLHYAYWYEDHPVPSFRQWLNDIAVHKQELYPSLRRVVLWQVLPDGGHVEGRDDKAAWEKRIMDRLDLKQEFEDAGIELEFHQTDVAPEFEHNELCL